MLRDVAQKILGDSRPERSLARRRCQVVRRQFADLFLATLFSAHADGDAEGLDHREGGVGKISGGTCD